MKLVSVLRLRIARWLERFGLAWNRMILIPRFRG